MVHRVVVTGIGVVSALGLEIDALAEHLLEAQSAASVVSLFSTEGFPTRIAAEVRDPSIDCTRHDRKSEFALRAARSAVVHAQTCGKPLTHQQGRAALCAGIGLDLFSMPDMVTWMRQERAGRQPGDCPPGFLQTQSDACIHEISSEHGLRLPPLLHVSACAASTDAIGQAFRLLRAGEAEWLLAGGSDSMINPMGFAGFCKIQAMTTHNDSPKSASRPFDRQRDGFLLGEGAAMLVLETWAHAQQRGAKIHAEILGWGNSFDAHGISEPHPQGAGACLAIRRALADSKLEPADIRHINAHGTSTPKNDPAETAALHQALGNHAACVSVNATKSMLGHLIAASGAMEVAAQIGCGNMGWLHPTINLDEVDAQCGLPHVANAPQPWKSGGIMLKNSCAFGGQNSCLVLRVI